MKNTQFVRHAVTKRRICLILRRSIKEVENFSDWEYLTVSYFREIRYRHIAFVISR